MDISKFVEWAKAGRRQLEVRLDNYHGTGDTKIRVWCYDYSLMAGKHVPLEEGPPTDKDLKEHKRQRLQEELNAMDSK